MRSNKSCIGKQVVDDFRRREERDLANKRKSERFSDSKTSVSAHLEFIASSVSQREFFIDNLVVRIHFIIVMIRWTSLAPW